MSEITKSKFLDREKSLTVTPDAFTSGYYFRQEPGTEPSGYTSISAATAFTIAASNEGRTLLFVVTGNALTFSETHTIGQSDGDIKTLAGGMWTGNTETGAAVTHQSGDQTIDIIVDDLTVAGDSGSTAMTPGDTLTIAGGGDATTAMSGDTLTVTVSAPAPGLKLLATQTASNVASLDFDEVFSSTYNTYIVKISGLRPATDASGIFMRLGTGTGTPTYYANTEHAYTTHYVNSASNTGIASSGGASSMLSTVDLGNDAGLGAVGTLNIYNPTETGSTYMDGFITGYSSVWSGLVTHNVSGAEFQGAAITSVRFLFDAGNITSGTIEIYGCNKTV